MRIRPIVWALVLVGAFWYFTSEANWSLSRLFRPVRETGQMWSEPDTAHTAPALDNEANNIEVYKIANQATVNVTSIVYREDWFMRVFPEEGQGSGFLIDPEGDILTNHHVVRGSSRLTVTLPDKRQFPAKVLGSDARNDLALIKIDAPGKLPFLKLGDSDHLQVGQKVLAIGNPFGLAGSLTTGVVSSLGRTLQADRERALEDMIQTDAAINPGNSGGPLLDSRANVIGINTAIFGAQGNIGIGFAMPVNRAKGMLNQYRANGRITRPHLGVQTVFVSGHLATMLELPAAGGLLVQRVERGSAAAQAGLRGPREVVVVGNYQIGVGGDLITGVEGQPIDTAEALQRAMDRKHAGDPLRLSVYRNGRTQQITVRLGEAPADVE
ncbi:MAG TPA: trypsin-like peptidase domain-containing protein [Bryobacteraceae bacterium]|nr:trypsin-like peptidase domain-containing protein [Bryobacteraceae bacterium]